MKPVQSAFFDVDGTLTNERTWKGFLCYFRKFDPRPATYYRFIIYHYALYFIRKARLINESDFRATWALDMAWFLKDYSEERARPAWEHTLGFVNKHWRPDTLKILNRHQENRDLVVIVSSGPLPMIERIAREIGVEHVVATRVETIDGIYTGKSIKPACIAEFKASMAKSYLRQAGIEVDFSSSKAYADSIADRQMLEMVSNPVAVYPGDQLRSYATKMDWEIYPGP